MTAFLLWLLLAVDPLQATVDTAIPATGQRIGDKIELPAGDYVLTDTLNLDTVLGLYIEGRSSFKTRIVWNGPSDKPIIWMQNCNQCELSRLAIVIPPGYSASKAIYITNEPERMVNGFKCVSSANVFRDIQIGDNNGNKYVDAIEIRNFGDANNELHIFDQVKILGGYTQSAWRMFGSQIHSLVFRDCWMTGKQADGSLAPYGVWAEHGGTFHWSGGSGGYHQCDFRLQTFQLVSTIRGWNSEGSTQFVVSSQGDANAAPIIVEGCRLDGNDVGAGFVHRSNGILLLRGNQIVSKTGRCIVDQAGLGGETAGQVISEGNAIYHATGEYTTAQPFVVADRSKVEVHHRGNVFRSYETATGSRGDQVRTEGGMALATATSPGALSATTQVVSAEKTFANQWNEAAGLTIKSAHNDGRMTIESKSGAAMTFWHNQPIIDIAPHVDLRLPSGVTLGPQTGYGAHGAAYQGGMAQLRIDAYPNWVDVFPMKYAANGYPGLRLTAPAHEFYASSGTWPEAGGFGTRVLRIDAGGVTIGGVRLKPLPGDDLEFISPWGLLKLSDLAALVNQNP